MARPLLNEEQIALLRRLAQGETIASMAAEHHVTRSGMQSWFNRIYDRLQAVNAANAIHRAHILGVL